MPNSTSQNKSVNFLKVIGGNMLLVIIFIVAIIVANKFFGLTSTANTNKQPIIKQDPIPLEPFEDPNPKGGPPFEGKVITLYKNFSSNFDANNITKFIQDNWVILQTSRGIEDMSLFLVADVESDEQNLPYEYQSVYLYIDDIAYSGHLEAYRTGKNNLAISSAGVYSALTEIPKIFDYPTLKQNIFISNSAKEGQGSKSINYFDILSDSSRKHYLAAFATPVKIGIIREMTLYYKCKPEFPNCEIKKVKD